MAIFAIFWFVTFRVRRRWENHRAETVGQWAAAGVKFLRGPAGGQFGGLESVSVTRTIRGIGFVALTDKDLRVTRSMPPATWIITYKQIKGVMMQQSFMGKLSNKNPFIVVRFTQDGVMDKLGFLVNDTEAWAKQLAKLAGVTMKDER